DHRESGHVLFVRDAADAISVLHDRLLRTNDGTRAGVEARPNMELHRECLGDLHGPWMHDPSTGAGQLEHLGVGDAREQSSGRHEAWSGRIDASNVGEDFTAL